VTLRPLDATRYVTEKTAETLRAAEAGTAAEFERLYRARTLAAAPAGRRDLDHDQVTELLKRIDAERAGRDLIAGLATLPERDRAVIELVDIAGSRRRKQPRRSG
jgi:hypothetical protein